MLSTVQGEIGCTRFESFRLLGRTPMAEDSCLRSPVFSQLFRPLNIPVRQMRRRPSAHPHLDPADAWRASVSCSDAAIMRFQSGIEGGADSSGEHSARVSDA